MLWGYRRDLSFTDLIFKLVANEVAGFQAVHCAEKPHLVRAPSCFADDEIVKVWIGKSVVYHHINIPRDFHSKGEIRTKDGSDPVAFLEKRFIEQGFQHLLT